MTAFLPVPHEPLPDEPEETVTHGSGGRIVELSKTRASSADATASGTPKKRGSRPSRTAGPRAMNPADPGPPPPLPHEFGDAADTITVPPKPELPADVAAAAAPVAPPVPPADVAAAAVPVAPPLPPVPVTPPLPPAPTLPPAAVAPPKPNVAADVAAAAFETPPPAPISEVTEVEPDTVATSISTAVDPGDEFSEADIVESGVESSDVDTVVADDESSGADTVVADDEVSEADTMESGVESSDIDTVEPDVESPDVDLVESSPEAAPEPRLADASPALAPVEAAAVPVDVEPVPVDVEPVPTDVEPVPVDVEPVPVDAEPVPTGAEPVPVDVEPVPTGAEPVPVDVEPVPTGAEPVPVDVEPVPVDAEPVPVDLEPVPTDADVLLSGLDEPVAEPESSVDDSDALAAVFAEAQAELAAEDDSAALSLRGVSKSFGDTRAVEEIDLTVPTGTFYGLVGPNGAGKTTTLSMIAGLLTPDRGVIRIAGVDAASDSLAAKRLMGVLPDRLRTFDRLTGRQLLYYYGVLRGLPRAVVESRTADLARAFDLTDALGRVVSDYSAGMLKKVMLAGAMIHSPRVLVLDEPFEAVDPVSSAVILDILSAYVAHGGTVILSSHGMELVERVCTRVAVIVSGQVLAEGTVDEVRGELTLEQRFIELAGGLSDVEGLEWLHTFSG
ncbi:ATP-binding cassette domain-containing protein [Microbacterium sp. NPDC055910]|uniref:ABC transporter ATP-binding protein n=1 Tax=Microbacterium sp. NPDC055910 TaxID=3345659 RepID=UPI0035E34832